VVHASAMHELASALASGSRFKIIQQSRAANKVVFLLPFIIGWRYTRDSLQAPPQLLLDDILSLALARRHAALPKVMIEEEEEEEEEEEA